VIVWLLPWCGRAGRQASIASDQTVAFHMTEFKARGARQLARRAAA
jgi:hypothetical protein